MKCLGDDMLKIDKVNKVEKFGVQAYVVKIQLCIALALAMGIRPPTKMADPSLESYIYALDDHLQTF
jgi:hypothetical protein